MSLRFYLGNVHLSLQKSEFMGRTVAAQGGCSGYRILYLQNHGISDPKMTRSVALIYV